VYLTPIDREGAVGERGYASVPLFNMMELEEHWKRTSLQRFALRMFSTAGRRDHAASRAKSEALPQNRMVPSDPLPSLAPHWHAQLKPQQSGPRDVVLLAPRLSVFQKSASMP